MSTLILDGSTALTPAAVRDALADALALDTDAPRNLDALFDRLTEPGCCLCITLRHPAGLQSGLGRWYISLVRMLQDAAAENPAVTLCREE